MEIEYQLLEKKRMIVTKRMGVIKEYLERLEAKPDG